MSFRAAQCQEFKYSVLSIVVVCLVFIAGCGDSKLANVRGVIKLDGKPLPNAFVQFMPESDGATSFGKTEADGSYRMKFSDTAYGAFIGSNRVSIKTGDIKPDNSGRIPEIVPSVYNSKTKLTADVVPGSNTFNFELDSTASPIVKPVYE